MIRLAKQILTGVAFLHRNNVVHLDLKVSASARWQKQKCGLQTGVFSAPDGRQVGVSVE